MLMFAVVDQVGADDAAFRIVDVDVDVEVDVDVSVDQVGADDAAYGIVDVDVDVCCGGPRWCRQCRLQDC